MVHRLDNYVSFTNEIFGQLLSNYSRYAANLSMKAVRFFTHPVRAVARALNGGLNIQIFMLCPINFFSNQVDFKRN